MIVEHLMEEEDMTTEIDTTHTEDETPMMITIKSTLGEVKESLIIFLDQDKM